MLSYYISPLVFTRSSYPLHRTKYKISYSFSRLLQLVSIFNENELRFVKFISFMMYLIFQKKYFRSFVKSQQINFNDVFPQKNTKLSILMLLINMLTGQIDRTLNEKKFYIKKRLIKDEALIYNGSIFPSSQQAISQRMSAKQSQYRNDTIASSHQKTITQQFPRKNSTSLTQRSDYGDTSKIFPNLRLVTPTAGLKKIKNFKTAQKDDKSKQKEVKQVIAKEKILIDHYADPVYIKLQRGRTKRAHSSFDNYKQKWVQQSVKRKDKSLIESSLEKAQQTIEVSHKEFQNRRKTSVFVHLLRNNYAEKKFIYPARMRPDINGIKGIKGGKPLLKNHSFSLLIQQMYKHQKSP